MLSCLSPIGRAGASLHLRAARRYRPCQTPSTRFSPYSILSRSNTISFEAAARSRPGSASSAARSSARRWSRRREPSIPRGTSIRCTAISCGPAIQKCRSSTRSIASATATVSTRDVSSDPARRGDLFDVGIVPGRRGRPRPPDTAAARLTPPETTARATADLKELYLAERAANIRSYWEQDRPIELKPLSPYAIISAAKSRRQSRMSGSRTTVRCPMIPLCTLRPCLCLGHDVARHVAVCAWPLDFRSGSAGRQSRSCACGSTGPAASTIGCFIRQTARAHLVRVVLTGAQSSVATAL